MKSLKTVLLINATSSAASGLLLIIFSGFFAEIFGTTDKLPYLLIGIGLIPFAVSVYLESRKDSLQPGTVKGIIWMDLLWVTGSLALIIFRPFGLTDIGYVLIGVMAAWVGVMAALQYRGLQKLY